MNIKPEYIRYLDLPELDINLKTLPVEKRLYLCWNVNPIYTTDAVTGSITATANNPPVSNVVYTIPTGYRFLLNSFYMDWSHLLTGAIMTGTFSGTTIRIHGLPVNDSLSAGVYYKCTSVPQMLFKAGDTINFLGYHGGASGNFTLNYEFGGQLYEVAINE